MQSGGDIAPLILNSALDGGEMSASRSGRFNPVEYASIIHGIGENVSKIEIPTRQPLPYINLLLAQSKIFRNH